MKRASVSQASSQMGFPVLKSRLTATRGIYYPNSRADGNGGADRHELPDFVDLGVGDGDAAVSPVGLPVERADPSELFAEAVNLDIAAGALAELARAFAVGGVRIRDVERTIEPAVRVLRVHHVLPLRRLVIADAVFRSHRLAAQRDFVCLQHLAAGQQCHRARGLHYDDALRGLRAGGSLAGARQAKQHREP